MNQEPEQSPTEPRKAILLATSGGVVQRYEPPTEEGVLPGERKPDADQIEERRMRLDAVCTRLAESNPFFVAFQDYAAKLDNGAKASKALKGTQAERDRLNKATLQTATLLSGGNAKHGESAFLAIAGRAAQNAQWYEKIQVEAERLQVGVEYVPYMIDGGMSFGTARRFFELQVPPENARKIWGMIYRNEPEPETPDYGAQSAAVRAFRAKQQQSAQLPVMASAGNKPGGASRRPKKGKKARR